MDCYACAHREACLTALFESVSCPDLLGHVQVLAAEQDTAIMQRAPSRLASFFTANPQVNFFYAMHVYT